MSTEVAAEVFENAVTVSNGKPVITSLKIAEIFDKRHDNVMRDVKSLQVPDAWCALNFEETSIEVKQPNGGVRNTKAYLITKDGYMMLAMGFTGEKAMQFKIILIEAFNRMEAELRRPKLPYHERKRLRQEAIARKKTKIRESTIEAFEALLRANGHVTVQNMAEYLSITAQSVRKRCNGACRNEFFYRKGMILRKNKELPGSTPAPVFSLSDKPDLSRFNFDVIPAGVYKFTVAKLERKIFEFDKVEIGECYGAKLTLKISDVNDTLAGVIVEKLYLLKPLRWKLARFFYAIGKLQPNVDDYVPDWDNLENSGGLCRISIHAHDRGDGTCREFNDIEFLEPMVNLKTLVA